MSTLSFGLNSSFDLQTMRTSAGEITGMDEEEFAQSLREAGYGERAIQKEVQALRDYKATMFPVVLEPVPEEPEQPTDADPWSASSRKKRAERKIRFARDTVFGEEDEEDDIDDA